VQRFVGRASASLIQLSRIIELQEVEQQQQQQQQQRQFIIAARQPPAVTIYARATVATSACKFPPTDTPTTSPTCCSSQFTVINS